MAFDTRYDQNPLGSFCNQLMFMVSPDVQFQLLWETRNAGQVQGRKGIRL